MPIKSKSGWSQGVRAAAAVALTSALAVGCSADAGEAEDLDPNIGTNVQALSAQNIRVLTLNVRYDEPKSTGLEGFSTRRSRINAVIRALNPDIIGLQEVEEHMWPAFRDDFPDYHGDYEARGGPTNGDEGVGMLFRKRRFDRILEREVHTLTYEERMSCLTDDFARRDILRAKVIDKVTNRTLDVFTTHWPSSDDCSKNRMARKVARWVEDFGDNVILMGDFNSGYTPCGGREGPYDLLLSKSSVPLSNAYKSVRGVAHNDPFITDKADEPEKRTGRMIDHILFGPAYTVSDSDIDRSLFSGSTRVTCDDDTTDATANKQSSCFNPYSFKSEFTINTRSTCFVPYLNKSVSITSLKSYSDHWAVWADLKRVDCPNGC